MSPPGVNRGSWAAVEVEGIGSLAAVLSFLSDLPDVGFFEEGIFSLCVGASVCTIASWLETLACVSLSRLCDVGSAVAPSTCGWLGGA